MFPHRQRAMSRLSSLILLLLLIGALPGCEVLVLGEDEVSGHSIGEVLFITNTTSARIYYFAVGRETAAHINWAPHLGREKSVGKGATVRIHHEDIFSFGDRAGGHRLLVACPRTRRAARAGRDPIARRRALTVAGLRRRRPVPPSTGGRADGWGRMLFVSRNRERVTCPSSVSAPSRRDFF